MPMWNSVMKHTGMTGKMWSIPAGLSVLSINKITQIIIKISLCCLKTVLFSCYTVEQTIP